MSWQDLNSDNCFEVHVTADLLKPPVIGGAGGSGYRMMSGDAFAHVVICEVVRGGEPVDLSGYTCNAYISKGSASGWWSNPIENTKIEGNKIRVWFGNSIYNAEGVVRVEFRMNKTGRSTYTTIAIVDFVCQKSVTNNGSGQVPTTEAWTSAMMDAYLTAMRNVVDSYVAQGGGGTGSGAVEDVFEWIKKWQGLAGTEDAWTSGRSYSQGAYVLYDNCLWRCKVANSGQTPGAGSSYWERESMATVESKVNAAVSRVDAAVGQIDAVTKSTTASVSGTIQAIGTDNLKVTKVGKMVVLNGYVTRSGAVTSGAAVAQIPSGYTPQTGAITYVHFVGNTTHKVYYGAIESGSTYIKLYTGGETLTDSSFLINNSWVTN